MKYHWPYFTELETEALCQLGQLQLRQKLFQGTFRLRVNWRCYSEVLLCSYVAQDQTKYSHTFSTGQHLASESSKPIFTVFMVITERRWQGERFKPQAEWRINLGHKRQTWNTSRSEDDSNHQGPFMPKEDAAGVPTHTLQLWYQHDS